ncbi:hypothetical protein PCASD_19596 [Puccinia coronata f. sp. avenae]|uniref:Uncharacterized protein n=1 Tax=Puccinia coronata f. sp. avenae TaxID=200324 RepID=A0A2N5TSF7_9BASI|nr:hypothetical protein PCASD_19596 [Puccinia coronata f. sp. avenae]
MVLVYKMLKASLLPGVHPSHCQQCWLGWSHPSLHRMQPSDSNSGAGPPSESRTDSNSVAKRQGHQLFELDCLDEVARQVQYQSEVPHADGGSGKPPPNSDEDKQHVDPWEDQEEQPLPNLPENHQLPTPGSAPLLSSISDYHQTVQQQRLAAQTLSNWARSAQRFRFANAVQT